MHDLKQSKYRIGAVVSKDLNVTNVNEAMEVWASQGIKKIRIASEYFGIADYFARNFIKSEYQIIPISGASEGFVPEDAEILVEGTETGATLEANNLEMKDLILESTNCIIGHKNLIDNVNPLIVDFINRFQ
jgi:ATP phosphoribosyltransferase